jgi:hypothetical protein
VADSTREVWQNGAWHGSAYKAEMSLNSSVQKKCTCWYSSTLAECLWIPNRGCEYSEAVGGEFQQLWRWCETWGHVLDSPAWLSTHKMKSALRSAHPCKSVDYGQGTLYRAECQIQCIGNDVGNTVLLQSLCQVGLTYAHTGTWRPPNASLSAPAGLTYHTHRTFSWQHRHCTYKQIASTDADCYERSVQTLVHRWRKCIASGGD